MDVLSWRDSRQTQSFTLEPGTHRLLTSSGVSIPFTVTTTGSVDYDPAYESVFARNDKTLTVRGLPTAIDAGATSYETYTIIGVTPDAIARTQSPVLHLLPGPHLLTIPGVGVRNQFSITPTGRVDYDPSYDKAFAGRDTTTLILKGLPVQVDAKSTTFERFAVLGVTGPVDARQAHSFQLLPGTHQVAPSTGTTVTFDVTTPGNVDYDASLDDVLDGRGTPRLLFRGPRWGYVRMTPSYVTLGTEVALTGPYQWGTWRNSTDPMMAKRVPTVLHQETGVYLIRMPGIGSDNGIAHVTTGWWPYNASCVVRSTERSGADGLIVVACYDSAGALKDTSFHLSFGEPSASGTPMAAIRYDVLGGAASADPLSNPATANTTGGTTRIDRLEQGRYRATVAGMGFAAHGYAQITPLGNKPVWCQNAGTSVAGEALQIDVDCYMIGNTARVDTGWALSYVQGAPLTHNFVAPGAYAQTTLTPPGLAIDPARSYNSMGGAMTVLRDNPGNYLVGFKVVAHPGNLFHAVALGSKPGYCRVEGWWNTAEPAGETWVRVVCTAEVPFGVVTLRPPGGPTGPLDPTAAPAVHPPGPKWAHARVGIPTYNIPLNIETEVDPDEQWGTWVRTLPQVDARWAKRATVVRLDNGEYQVRLPGVGSPTGIAQVTVSRPYYSGTPSCAVRDYWQDGTDELVRVACFSGTSVRPGTPINAPFSVLFTDPGASATPAATIRYGRPGGTGDADPLSNRSTFNSTGGRVHIHREGSGSYNAIMDGPEFTAAGHIQITPLTPAAATPVWCQSTGAERTADGMRISIGCWDFAKTPAQPHDSEWLLSYVQDAPPNYDPAVPGAYARTTLTPPAPGIDQAHSYSSTGGAIQVLRANQGQFLVGFRGMGATPTGANTFQINVTGPTPGYCYDAGYDHYFAYGAIWTRVDCIDAARALKDLPFDVAVLRPPYGPIGSLNPAQPGPHPPGPRWGYAYMNAIDAPIGAETGLNFGSQWGTWLGTLDPYAARWLAQSTVTREAIGVSRVRLPNIGSPTGIPHVTVEGQTALGDACAVHDFVQSGVDELIRVSCYDGSGQPKNVRFRVFFGEPSTGGTPMVASRSDTPGDGVHITRLGPGSYRAILNGAGFDATGYTQITALGDKPVRCQNAGTAMDGTAMRIDVNCYTIGTAIPTDTEWLFTHVQRAPLTHDTREPGAYAQLTSGPNGLAIDKTRSYTSSGEAITLVKESTGLYRVRFAGIARSLWADPMWSNGQTAQVVALGSSPGHCRVLSVGHQDLYAGVRVAEVRVSCYDASGKAADVPFGVAVIRSP